VANKSLFQGIKSIFKKADTRNEAGGIAYSLSAKHQLAQLAATGCFNGTFYATAEDQLNTLLTLAGAVNDNTFLAKLAIYSRERAQMKDMPCALTALLAGRDTALFHKVFDRVIDNGRVVRTLFQMIRSGQFGKKSLTSSVQRAFRRWLNGASVDALLSASIGDKPSLRDVLRMARPTPKDNARRALFGWLTEKPIDRWAPASEADLPEQVRALAAFRAADSDEVQAEIVGNLRIRWDLLADKAKGPAAWAAIAKNMGPQALRMNLNTLSRHGVLELQGMREAIASRLSDADEIRRGRQLPYQYLAAYLNADDAIRIKVRSALHQAAELSCGNVPALPGPVVIGLDVSGSMSSAVTGNRGYGATSKMRCVDVAALFAAAILRRNPDSVVIPFDTSAYDAKLDPSDSILSLAERLAKYGGGGTDCSLPLIKANRDLARRKFAGVVLVSDNESWVYKGAAWFGGVSGTTGAVTEWNRFVENQRKLDRNAQPKLVCINIQPYGTTQAPERDDILNVGGFSDAVFASVAAFMEGDAGRFVQEVENVKL
jgi:60 kDa SS-A/Ro ribonucleoprotein